MAEISDRDVLLNSFPGIADVDDARVCMVEEMFRSKVWKIPDEFKALSIPEVNSVFLTALLKMQDQDRNSFCGKSNDTKELGDLAIYVKEYIYALNSEIK